MKISNYRFLKTGIVAALAIVMFTKCEDDNEVAVSRETIDAKITANSELSLFNAALDETGLNSFTEGGGPFTVWAPTNTAFNAIGINSAADLKLIDSNRLVQILTYHIQAGNRSFTEIPLGPNATMTTQGGLTQYASRKTGGAAYINGVEVTTPNLQASNGYLHIINRVLIPPFLTMGSTIALIPDYKLMLQAITRTSTTTLTNPLTIFAVPNSVMVAAGYDSTAIANASGPALVTLTAIVRYHIVNRRIFSPDFTPGILKTVQGTNIVIAGSGANLTVKGTTNPTPFTVTTRDIITTTGVVHGISGLLRP